MKRPLVWVGVALAAGTWVAAMGFFPGVAAPVGLCFAGLLVPLVWHRRRIAQPLGISLSFFAVGALLWNVRHAALPGDPLSRYAASHSDAALTLEGRVRNPDLLLPDGDGTRFILDVERVAALDETLPLRGKVLVRWAKPGEPVYSDERVRVESALELRLGPLNPGLQDVEDFFRRYGVHSQARIVGPNAVQRIGPGRWWSPTYWASRLRVAEAHRLQRAMPDDVLPFVLAVWLGDRNRLPRSEYEFYIVSGTAHILSVSGVHASIIFVSVSALVRLVLRKRRLRTLLTMGLVFLFALMAGAQVATVRAAIMIGLYLLADLLDREPDTPTALSLSGILFLLHNPGLLFDAGFQLTFASVGSMLIFNEPLAAYFGRVPRTLRDGLVTSLSVQILPWPLAVRIFHVFPLAAPVANMIVIPLLTVVLWLCFAAGVCVFVLPPAALLFGYALTPAVYAIRGITEFMANMRGAYVRLTSPSALAIFCYYGAVAVAFRGAAALHPRRWAIAAATLAGLTWLCWRPLVETPQVVFLDVGHGDAAFIRSPGGTTVLIDAGDVTKYVDMGARIVAPFLWANHVSRLDYAVVSHPDRDHAGGLPYVLDHFQVGCVLLGPSETQQPLEQRILERCRANGIPVYRVGQGSVAHLAGAALEVLHPPQSWPGTSPTNDASLVLRLRWPGMDVLFTGDVEAAAENEVGLRDCRATVIKAPHHGSRTSSSEPFVGKVGPVHAVVSTGGYRGREPVDDEVVRRYGRHGATVWRTDRLGAILLGQRNGELLIEAERLRRRYPTVLE